MTIRLTVYCGSMPDWDTGDRWGCGAVLGTFYDRINEKWPFWCENCETRGERDKYPWEIVAEVVTDENPGDGL